MGGTYQVTPSPRTVLTVSHSDSHNLRRSEVAPCRFVPPNNPISGSVKCNGVLNVPGGGNDLIYSQCLSDSGILSKKVSSSAGSISACSLAHLCYTVDYTCLYLWMGMGKGAYRLWFMSWWIQCRHIYPQTNIVSFHPSSLPPSPLPSPLGHSVRIASLAISGVITNPKGQQTTLSSFGILEVQKIDSPVL